YETGCAGTAVDAPPRDRAAIGVSVLHDGEGEPGLGAPGGVVAVEPLHDVPAVVLPPLSSGNDVDLLPLALPHVGDVELVRGIVEVEAPGVAKSVRPDLSSCAGASGERVVGRDPV